ncbi:BLUF domain-containing protein [Leucobacter luti]|uniref:FAD-dependent sensor of blue light n=1 Tax=Leucobacter luti TaxID=340320 RepID=A0A4R6RSL1_9MICO|nr:BLUF domain-containing protein [Leucobacter luti]QYM76939.1 BLUF domain-containing protein [Leucobacter luti]TDP89810.1 FAD-dependent sensor of blue light [Leucobacter luti]
MSSNPVDLRAIVYSSDATAPVDEPQLIELLERARSKNGRLGITGILFFRGGRFLQYIEGPRTALDELYDDISRDSRHTHLRVLLNAEISERRFDTWRMGYEALRPTSPQLPEGFRDTFAEIERADSPEHVMRALNELTIWFRARSARG